MSQDEKTLLVGGLLVVVVLWAFSGDGNPADVPGGTGPARMPDEEDALPPTPPGAEILPPPETFRAPKPKGGGKRPVGGKEEAAKRAASKAYQLAAAAGFDHHSASAFALSAYHEAGGSAKDVIANWQGEIGVPPTGEYDNATQRRVKELK